MRHLIIPLVILSLSFSLLSVKAEDNQAHLDLMYYLDSKGNKQPVKSIQDWEKRKAHIREQMQSVMGPVPTPENPVPLNVKVLEETTFDGLVRKKSAYHTDSNTLSVNAYLFLPDRSKAKPVPAVLCLHQTTKVGKEEPAGIAGLPHLHYALELAQRGYVTLAPDYPSFGEYVYEFGPQTGYRSGSMKAIYDNIRAIDLLTSLPEVDADRIGCIGHSLGGHNTMFTAAFDERIKAIVSNCGFTRFHKYYGGKLKGWTSPRYMPVINDQHRNDPNQVPFDFPEIIGIFAPRPFLASSPINDDNFDVSGVRDSIQIAAPIYELYQAREYLQANYPDCAHHFPEPARERAYSFFDQSLNHTPTTPKAKRNESGK